MIKDVCVPLAFFPSIDILSPHLQIPMGNLARKASDLIRETSGRWLNIDPCHAIEVGDYGEIEPETGRFVGLGNIYESPEVKAVVPDIRDHKVVIGKTAQEEKVKSKQAMRWSFDLDPKVSVANVVDGSIQLQFEVETGQRAAYLVAKTSRTDHLPTGPLLRKLSKVKELSEMYLVTERTICCGYSFGITTAGSFKVGTSVTASAPIPAPAPVTAGGEATFIFSGNSTVDWSVRGEEEDFTYVTTMTMRFMNPEKKKKLFGLFRYRDGTPDISEDDLWIPAPPPWAPLNADGEEILPDDD